MSEHPNDSEAAASLAMAGDLRALIGRLSRRMREESHVGDFTSSQKSVLIRLDRDGPATLTALARAEGMRPQSMGAIVSVLEAAGIISGSQDPTDGRQTILAITPAARETIAVSRAAKVDWLFRTIQSTLSAAEREQLAAGIALRGRLVDPQPAQQLPDGIRL